MMKIPKICRKRKANLVDAVKIILIASDEEIEGVYKEISLTMQKMAKKGYCKNGYLIANGVIPKNN